MVRCLSRDHSQVWASHAEASLAQLLLMQAAQPLPGQSLVHACAVHRPSPSTSRPAVGHESTMHFM